jgi:hypothetical protein
MAPLGDFRWQLTGYLLAALAPLVLAPPAISVGWLVPG